MQSIDWTLIRYIWIFFIAKRKTNQVEDGSSAGTIAAVVIIVLILVVVVAAGVVYYFYREGRISVFGHHVSSYKKAEAGGGGVDRNSGLRVPQAVNEYEHNLEERKNHAFIAQD